MRPATATSAGGLFRLRDRVFHLERGTTPPRSPCAVSQVALRCQRSSIPARGNRPLPGGGAGSAWWRAGAQPEANGCAPATAWWVNPPGRRRSTGRGAWTCSKYQSGQSLQAPPRLWSAASRQASLPASTGLRPVLEHRVPSSVPLTASPTRTGSRASLPVKTRSRGKAGSSYGSLLVRPTGMPEPSRSDCPSRSPPGAPFAGQLLLLRALHPTPHRDASETGPSPRFGRRASIRSTSSGR